ncbi:MAG: hypothetical protein O3C67_12030 [Cyanobacteria bacterium]|nr:hypothetical protein [Cyanobacteriota bacterium]
MEDAQQLSCTDPPEGLDRRLAAALMAAATQATPLTPSQLLEQVRAHRERAAAIAATNPMVNLALANALATLYGQLVAGWEQLSPAAVPWLKGAMLYFAKVDDDDPDFDSPIGFEDDVEVLNACLTLAGLSAQHLNPEDFD